MECFARKHATLKGCVRARFVWLATKIFKCRKENHIWIGGLAWSEFLSITATKPAAGISNVKKKQKKLFQLLAFRNAVFGVYLAVAPFLLPVHRFFFSFLKISGIWPISQHPLNVSSTWFSCHLSWFLCLLMKSKFTEFISSLNDSINSSTYQHFCLYWQ